RLKRPHGFSNPGGFDYEGWLFQHGIRATGYVRSRGENRRLVESQGYPVARLRQYLDGRFDLEFRDSEYLGIAKALAIGLRHDLNDDQWQILRATGTSHLMAISGLHIGLVAGFTFLLARRLWSRAGSAPLYLAAPRFAALPALLAALIYAALAGFSIPTQRALVMVVVVMAAMLLRGRPYPSHSLAVAMLLILLVDPLAVLSAGFWLSFVAVAIILFGMGGRVSGRGFWWRWGRVHWLVAIGLLPVLLAFFGENPLLSPLANLLAVPWVGMVVVPLVLAGTLLLVPLPALGEWLLLAGLKAVELFWPFLDWLAGLDLVYRIPPVTQPLFLAAGGIGVILLLSPRGFPGRWLGVVWLTPLVFAPLDEGPEAGSAWLTLLDVGQGLAAVVRTSNHLLVYDTGPRYSAHFDAGHAVVEPYLRSLGIGYIDTLVISHGDNDHAGGAESLLAAVPAGLILTGEPDQRWPTATTCRRGRRWQWDGVMFRILHPGKELSSQDNNNSCVLQVSVDGESILLPGDIESTVEEALVEIFGSELRSRIMVAPHHGSRTSSSEEFLAAVSPEHILFSVGYRNRFGLPPMQVLQRYRSHGAADHETASRGAITFKLGKENGE
ncbi:MAG: DNA internalization-related competence protein ComEC/Rec2, partial [Gammaproteobacteria bacterium]|nr:DNA internalization-related competence protein ComEC/Rec2 [Gammaproteobacteria bacterium]